MSENLRTQTECSHMYSSISSAVGHLTSHIFCWVANLIQSKRWKHGSWDAVFILITTSVLTLLSFVPVNNASESQRYPYVLPKCCVRDGNRPPVGTFRTAAEGHIGSCGEEGPQIVLLPKQLFPAMSTDLEHVEVELRSQADGLDCDAGHETSNITLIHTEFGYAYYSDIDVGHQHLKPLKSAKIGKNNGFDDLAFSGNNLLSTHGNIYTPRHYCISPGRTNMTRLDIKLCKRKCSPQSPCIQRCCGGHQSILTSPPTSPTENLLGFCSTPSLGKNVWNPMASKIVRADSGTRFYQSRYAPKIQGDLKYSPPPETCVLHRINEGLFKSGSPLVFLEDGRLQMNYKVPVILEDFCIDGINGEEESSSLVGLGDTCEPPQKEEIVVIYACNAYTSTESASFGDEEGTLEDKDDILSLPACPCLARPPNQLLHLPKKLFPGLKDATEESVPVKLPAGGNAGGADCPGGYVDATLNFDDKNAEIVFMSLMLMETSPGEAPLCVRSVFQDLIGLRLCRGEPGDEDLILDLFPVEKENSFWDWPMLVFVIIFGSIPVILSCLSLLLYVATAVVYILRKDKDTVLHCSIVCSSISMALEYVVASGMVILLLVGSSYAESLFIAGIMTFCNWYAFVWLSVLCFDVWLNIVFLTTGKKSMKRLWGYVAFTLLLPIIVVAYRHSAGFLDPTGIPSKVFGYLLHILRGGLLFINVVLFLGTAVKLWIAQNNSEIKNKKNTFLLYFKLFLVVGLHSILEILFVYVVLPHSENYFFLCSWIILARILHPIILFFLLVWDAETKRYLKTNNPRAKKVMDFIALIAYPVRKCWGLCILCRVPQEKTGREEIELPHCSTHMYVHKGGVPNTVK